MTDSALATGRGHRLGAHAVQLAAVLGAAALVLLVAVPFGWRFHLWHWRLSFQMVGWAQDLAAAAAVVALLGVIFARAGIGRAGQMLAALLVLVGIGFVVVPWGSAQMRGPKPPINDITTDTENPPPIVAALPARDAEQARPAAYGGAAVARQQQAAYPDIAPVTLAVPPAQGFARALATANSFGWTILTSNAGSGLIEATDTTRYFAFTDDIVIRVTPDGAGSRIDIRSHSRQGGGDFGVNAARVRKYLAALKE
jgi:uncharacterized protein (DUF1499 family)